jgi:hypothetical protein
VREVRVTFTVKDSEDGGEQTENVDLISVWQDFLEEQLTTDFDMSDVKVETVSEISREEKADEDDEEQG